jgi:excisionase family DNA binding protein
MENQKPLTAMALSQKGILTADEAAIYTGLAKSTILGLVYKKEIPHYRPVNRPLFHCRELDAWMEQRRIKAEEKINRRRELNALAAGLKKQGAKR